MKRVSGLEYGNTTWTFEVPDDAFVMEAPPAEQIRPPLADPLSALKQAMDGPLGMKPVDQLVDSGSRVAIALNDWMGGSYYAAPREVFSSPIPCRGREGW
jgi:lactate racemase-like protein